jgi:hypothetical protein
LRDDGVDNDLPSREEIEWALKYLKNNKAVGTDPIAAKLLKNGGPNLVDAVHAVYLQAWTGETLPKSWTEGVLYPVLTIVMCCVKIIQNDCSESFETRQGLRQGEVLS